MKRALKQLYWRLIMNTASALVLCLPRPTQRGGFCFAQVKPATAVGTMDGAVRLRRPGWHRHMVCVLGLRVEGSRFGLAPFNLQRLGVSSLGAADGLGRHAEHSTPGSAIIASARFLASWGTSNRRYPQNALQKDRARNPPSCLHKGTGCPHHMQCRTIDSSSSGKAVLHGLGPRKLHHAQDQAVLIC